MSLRDALALLLKPHKYRLVERDPPDNRSAEQTTAGRLLIKYSARATFDQAKTEAGQGYLAPEVLAGEYKQPKLTDTLLPGFTSPVFSAVSIAGAGEKDRPLRALDFGGAMGDMYWYVTEAFGSHIKLDWSVVETDLYLQYVKKLGIRTPAFFDSIEEAARLGEFDLAIFSGVLQYLEDWRPSLRHPSVMNSRYILLSRTPVGDEEIPFLQTRITPETTVSYPGRVLRSADIAAVLEKTHRLKMSWHFDQHSDELGIIPTPALLWERRA